MSREPIRSVWYNMLRRCENITDRNYAHYGGRGISVYARWRDAALFIEDIEQSLGACPAGHSFDRIDNDGNYEPGNVRWATATQQMLNRRITRKDWLHLKTSIGARFGRLVIVSGEVRLFRGKDVVSRPAYECLCDCGVRKAVFRSDLRAGRVVSCGCQRAEKSRARAIERNARDNPIRHRWR